MISKETTDKIVSACDIVDVIGDFVTLRKSGSNFKACCPFHEEKTASLIIFANSNTYKCFGCKAGGDSITFVMAHEQFNYPEALKYLAKKYSIDIVEDNQVDPKAKAINAKRDAIKILSAWAQSIFVSNLSEPAAMEYLHQRRFAPETIEAYGVGFALNSWSQLISLAKKQGYTNLLDASLAGEGAKGLYDYFHNRITFPIHDVSGNTAGFTARTLGDDKPKYLNSKDSELFSKGCLLFGLSLARKAIAKEDICIVVEGNTDVMRLYELGFKNVVASSGTALTKKQISLIRRFSQNVLLLYDGDNAGTMAIFKNGDALLAEGINVYVSQLPEGHDPDSYGLKNGYDGILDLIQRRTGFIQFKSIHLKQLCGDDVGKVTQALKELVSSLALIEDESGRNLYIKQAAWEFEVDAIQLQKDVKKQLVKIEVKENGWIGLAHARDAINNEDLCYITNSFDSLINAQVDGTENIISYSGKLDYSHIQELNSLTKNIELHEAIEELFNKDGEELPITTLCKRFIEYQLNVKAYYLIKPDYEDDEEYREKSSECYNFLHLYAKESNRIICENSGDESLRKKMIEQCAELLSKTDNTTITINTKTFAQTLGIKESDFKKVMKPFTERKRSKSVSRSEAIVIDGHKLEFEPERLPDYVEADFYNRWNYFPAQDKNGRKIFYVFRTLDGGLERIGNFYMEPLFHVYDPDPNRNKRIVKINNAESGATFYAEFQSGNMIDFSAFKKYLFNEGGNIFSKGKSHHHETILSSIANHFPKCMELHEFGQQEEGFFAFANAIYADGKVQYTDELGLVEHDNKTYYIPAFSKINADVRKSNDKYEQDKFFIYRENNNTSFEQWAELMNEVYKMNNNGKWAILHAIMSAFRSEIYKIDRLFTAPFFVGPTDSGKSQIAISIRSLFMPPEAPTFNLNSGTDAAFFTTMERYRDVPVIMEEYNDTQISDIKFQGLKAGVYDGEGKQKKKDASSKDLDISKVVCALILLGQENPTRDDGALSNRCILLYVPKKDDWSERERDVYEDLKERQKQGLSNILFEVLKQRDIIRKYYFSILREEFKVMKTDLSKAGDAYQTRILNTASLFLAMCKLLEQHVPTLKLPFSYNEFYAIARAQIVTQSENISNNNRLSTFFDSIEILLNQANAAVYGRDFKIEWKNSFTKRLNKKKTEEIVFSSERKILFMRLTSLHLMYKKMHGSEALSLQNLNDYIKDHPAYLGSVNATRFSWIDYVESQALGDDRAKRIGRPAGSNSSCIALDYEVLQELTGIDLEKYEEKPDDETKIFDVVKPSGEQAHNDGGNKDVGF